VNTYPDFEPGPSYLGTIYTATGRYDEAVDQFATDSEQSATLAGALARVGRVDDARAMLMQLVDPAATPSQVPADLLGMSSAYGALGEPDLAFGYLRQALDKHDISAFMLGTDGLLILPELTADERYTEMLEEIGLRERGQR